MWAWVSVVARSCAVLRLKIKLTLSIFILRAVDRSSNFDFKAFVSDYAEELSNQVFSRPIESAIAAMGPKSIEECSNRLVPIIPIKRAEIVVANQQAQSLLHEFHQLETQYRLKKALFKKVRRELAAIKAERDQKFIEKEKKSDEAYEAERHVCKYSLIRVSFLA